MLSIVLPCYNPPDGWAQNIVRNYYAIKEHVVCDVELVLVNDGSVKHIDDANISLLRSSISKFTYVDNKQNRGKGHAIRSGVQQATGDIIMYTDIDFPYTLESFLEVYNALKHGEADVVAGVKDAMYYEHVPFMRRVVSKTLRAMTRMLLSIPITDTQCGLKGFSKKASPIFLNTTIDRYLFDIEFIRSANKQQYKIDAIPVKLNDSVEFRRMNYKILVPEMINFVRIMFRK